MSKSMGMGKFRPPTAPKPLNRFWWNSKLRTDIWRPPTMQDFILIRQRGWSRRRIDSLPLLGFFLCFYWSLRHAHRSHRWTDFDDLYVTWRLSAQGCAFWGSCWCASPFRGSNPQNPNFGGVNRRFPAKPLKSKNMHIIKTTASISTKFCTAIKTTKCPLVRPSKPRFWVKRAFASA